MRIRNYFLRLVEKTIHHPKTTLLMALFLTVASLLAAAKIELRSNFSDLLPDDHPAVIQARDLSQVVGGASHIILVVETEQAVHGRFFVGKFSEIARRWQDEIRYVDDQPPHEFLSRTGLLYVSLADLDELKERVQRRIDQSRVEKSGLYIDLQEEERFDFSDLEEKYADFIKPSAYYTNEEENLFVALIKPTWSTTDVAQTKMLLTRLNAAVTAIQAQYALNIRVNWAGPYLTTMEQQGRLQRDAVVVSLLALFGSVAYLIFHFRSRRAVFLVGLPLAMSVSWNFGIAYLLFGSLNLFSSVVYAVTVGLAADYGIHLYSDYLRHRAAGETPQTALLRSVDELSQAFFIAATTTAGAFFALSVSHFKAFHEFGLIAGTGILLCALAFQLLFPPLVVFIEGLSPQRGATLSRSERSNAFLNHFPERLMQRRPFFFISLALLLPLFAVAAGGLSFDYNMRRIYGDAEKRELNEKVDSIFHRSMYPVVALASSPKDAPHLAEAIRNLRNQKQKAAEFSTVKDVIALSDFVPQQQREKILKIQGIKELFTDSVLQSMSDQERADYQRYQSLFEPARVRIQDLPEQIRLKFRDKQGEEGRIVFIFSNVDLDQADHMMRFVDEIREVKCTECEGPFTIAGEATVFYAIVEMLFDEGLYVMALALAVVALMLWVNFRSLKTSLLVFVPLAVGLAAMLGWMALFRIPFNIINLASLPIVIGIGTDYAVHLYQRYQNHPTTSLTESYSISFKPILGSALTTILGFAALLVADMGGVRSFGLVTVLGVLACSLSSLVWFPGLLRLTEQTFD